MTRDIKKLAKEIRKEEASLPLHHEANFERLLLAELHLKKTKRISVKWISIAASVAILISGWSLLFLKNEE